MGDVPSKNGYFEGFWDMIYYEVHLTSCLDCFAFYVLAINGSYQFGNFFREKESLNCQILERFQGSEGQKFKILDGKNSAATEMTLEQCTIASKLCIHIGQI